MNEKLRQQEAATAAEQAKVEIERKEKKRLQREVEELRKENEQTAMQAAYSE